MKRIFTLKRETEKGIIIAELLFFVVVPRVPENNLYEEAGQIQEREPVGIGEEKQTKT